MLPRFLAGVLFRPGRLLVLSIILAALSSHFVAKWNRQNPNSHFFSPDEDTYAGKVSETRKQAGREYIAEVKAALGRGNIVRHDATTTTTTASKAVPPLAVVFISVKRKNEQYLDAALGSFLRELSDEQRKKMHITVNIGDFNPLEHPFYEEGWLHALVDQIGVRMATKRYDLRVPQEAAAKIRLAQTKVTHIPVVDVDKNPLRTSPWHRKATLDYANALSTCSDVGAPHCLIVEDDVVFGEGWYSRFEPLLRKADSLVSPDHWGYIRLFWAEKYWGWEDYEVPFLVMACFVVVLTTSILAFVFCRLPDQHIRQKEKERDYQQLSGLRWNRMARVRLPLVSILILDLLALVHAILFILAGRNYVYKVPTGLSKMPARGCCTQAILYSTHDVVQPLAAHLLEHSGDRPYDIMINRWMEAHNREKLACNPPLLQHIGEGSSRQMVDDYWRKTPLWSFAFERASGQK